MAKVVIYTTSYCPFCTRAKNLLRSKGVAFQEIDVSDDDAKRQWLVKTTGMRTVPQIFVNEQALGGYDDIAELDRAGKLDALLLQP